MGNASAGLLGLPPIVTFTGGVFRNVDRFSACDELFRDENQQMSREIKRESTLDAKSAKQR